jgi:hypothetical protein
MKVIKTTFKEDQIAKEKAFLSLSPLERMDQMRKVRELMRKEGVNYSLEGKKVKVTKLL